MQRLALTRVQETLLITLYAKARDSRARRSVLHDTKADELVRTIDYDFKKLKAFGDRMIVVRAAQYDEWIRDFLGRHSSPVVLNLGCGLDTRVTRIDPTATIGWFDVDYPDVIEIRERFYREKPGYHLLASSVTADAWLHSIPADRPALIVAEGLFEYLKGEEVKVLLHRLTRHFGGGEIMFDVMSPTAIRPGLHSWAVDDPRRVGDFEPALEELSCLPLLESRHVDKLSWPSRLLYRSLSHLPQLNGAITLLRYRFPGFSGYDAKL